MRAPRREQASRLARYLIRCGWIASRGLSSDPTGRNALLLVGASTAAVLSLIWALSSLAGRVLERELFMGVLALETTPVTLEAPGGLGVADLRAVMSDSAALVTCESSGSVLTAGGGLLPIRMIASTPAYFMHRVRAPRAGRVLQWSDSSSIVQPAVVGAALASLHLSRYRTEHGTFRIVGQLPPRTGIDEDVVLVSLLRGSDIERRCGGMAIRSLEIIAPPPSLSAVKRRLERAIALRRGLAPSLLRLRGAPSRASVRVWTAVKWATRSAVAGATLLVAGAAALTLVVLLETRNHERRFELGVSRALGATRRDVMGGLLAESISIALMAVVLGIGPTIPVVWLLAETLAIAPPGPGASLACALLVVLIIVGSALWSGRAATKHDAIVGLGSETWS